MKTVVYTAADLLSCAKCNGQAIICVDSSLTATSAPYLTVTIASTLETTNNCGCAQYVYGLTYDENDLADPSYDLTAADVEGIFCKGCLTDWIEYLISTVGA